MCWKEISGKHSFFHSHPSISVGQSPILAGDAAIFDVFRTGNLSYLPLNPVYAMSVDAKLSEVARRELGAWSPEFCFPFRSDEGPFGLLLLGKKVSGEFFTANDLFMLDLLVKNLSIVLNQISLKTKVLQAQEMELLGRMSRGMAHDLNNLLTPISTFLQLCAANRPLNQLETLLPIAGRNIGTIRDYIREALFFSETHAAQFRPSRLDSLIVKVAQTFQPVLQKKSIALEVEAPTEWEVEMDEVLIQRLMNNLVSNAIDASPDHSLIRIEGQRAKVPRGQGDWVRLRVIDRGSGISRENLKRVRKPYFTTKVHGDENRGVGLGLAISERIARLHSGDLSIQSEENKGTTVQVEFPAEQPKAKRSVVQLSE